MVLDRKDREAVLEALDMAKDKHFRDLLEMNRQRTDSPEEWDREAWLQLSRKYNAVSRVKSEMEREMDLAEA